MKKTILILLIGLLSFSVKAFNTEMKTITLSDGEQITARLCLPDNEVKSIVFDIHGTGPHTYLNKRSGFNYYDELAKGFCSQGVAFFTYNRRGVEIGDTPPLFADVDSAKYVKYTPLQEAQDVESMLHALREDKRFSHCKMVLYGASEGTIIASLVADRKKEQVDALLLHGYAHENMFDILQWQGHGYGVMMMINDAFDTNKDNVISRDEYENQNQKATASRSQIFQNAPFEALDNVKDSVIDVKDISQMRAPFQKLLMENISKEDGAWIKKNYMNITPQWFKKHFELEANKTRLLRIDIPVHIFHGTDDANVPLESVYDLQSRFEACNKTNLTVHIFPKHNHDLNFLSLLTDHKWSEGLEQLFKCASTL
ncbi:MAG: alpha/beta hydrolase [Mucinivorans sp.]